MMTCVIPPVEAFTIQPSLPLGWMFKDDVSLTFLVFFDIIY
jgi:hypothetical protein